MALTFTIDQHAIMLVMDSASHRPLGTCFSFIKPTWVVTAKHVVFESGLPRASLVVALHTKPSISARVLFAHSELDLAVLEVQSAACERPLFPSHQSLAGSNGLICAGFAPSKTAHVGAYAVFVNNIPTFKIEVRERAQLNEEVIIFDAPFSEGGHSGGPIFGDGGGVVGVIIQHFRDKGRLFARGTSLIPLTQHVTFQQ